MRLPGVSHDTDLAHPDLRVTYHQAPTRERYQHCIGSIAPEVNLRVNNPDIRTLKTALLTRMFMCEVNGVFEEPPLPDRQLVNDRLQYFRSRITQQRATPVPLETVVGSYTGRKRTVYERACHSLSIKPVNRADSVSVAFVKPEKVPPNKAPRCIQPRDPRYNLEVGRYLKFIEHRMYKNIAKVFGDGPTVMKGYNVEQVARIMQGKWNSFRKPVALGLDATKFDMHVSPAMLAWEHSCYQAIYSGDARLRRLLSWQMHNIGRGYCKDGKLKYRVTGKRFSGDMNTAMGNCIIMCAMVHSYSAERGVETKLVNNGDDCVVFMESEDLDRFTAGLDRWFLEMGFRMVAEAPVYDLARVEFCQMHPIRTVNGITMVRNIPKAMAKDTMCLIPLRTPKEMREWVGAVGACGDSITRGVPILNSFYRCYSRNGSTTTKFGREIISRSGYDYYSKGVEGKRHEIIAEARYDVWLAWGILPDTQAAIEENLDRTNIEYGNQIVEEHSHYPHRMM